MQIFIRLIKDWCVRPFGEEKVCYILRFHMLCRKLSSPSNWISLISVQVPGFQSFMIEAFAMNCCLHSVLDKSFEFGDANTVEICFCFSYSFFIV